MNEILDADYTTEEPREPEYIYSFGANCHGLAREAVKARCVGARAYVSANHRKGMDRHWRLTALVQRALAGACLAVFWASVLALLVGWQ